MKEKIPQDDTRENKFGESAEKERTLYGLTHGCTTTPPPKIRTICDGPIISGHLNYFLHCVD